ncbi:MAG: hypothetical protein SOU51_02875, partial [Collinsella sp.]|nr:hypothetical protein [Collinsella sp.]
TRVGYQIGLVLSDPYRGRMDDIRAAMDRVAALHQIPYTRGKKSKMLDLDRTLSSHELVSGEGLGCDCLLVLDTRCDNDGALRPEIVLAALDRILVGGSLGEEPIDSRGIQDLVAISSYRPERVYQSIDVDGVLHDPLFGTR